MKFTLLPLLLPKLPEGLSNLWVPKSFVRFEKEVEKDVLQNNHKV